jgi:hypothetical protein
MNGMTPIERAAQAAEALVEGLTYCTSYPSGKWQAGGKDDTLTDLVNAVVDWQKDRARAEREEADATEPQELVDARQFMRDALGG